MANITKQALIQEIAKSTGFVRNDIKTVIEQFLDLLAEKLIEGNTIEIRGFGTFACKPRKARPARNPRTGETVMIDALGNIYINGELLSESYGKEAIKDPGMAANSIYLGSDEYFVLGDNRNNSSDSRDPSVGLIKRDQIIGRAWLRIFPFDKIGFVVHGR